MMKQSILTLFLCFLISATGFSQSTDSTEILHRRDRTYNEVSLNAFNLLLFGALDASYDRILSPQMGLSVDIFSVKLNKNKGEDIDLTEVFSKDFSLTTKFNYYFSETKPAYGFYAEAFVMYSDGYNEKDMEFIDEQGYVWIEEVEVGYKDVALGFGVGNKYVSKGGFVVDVSFGLGRNMFNADSPDLVVLPNVNLGYRF